MVCDLDLECLHRKMIHIYDMDAEVSAGGEEERAEETGVMSEGHERR